ncbi:MAG: hypothetical protein IKU34_00100 [Clostridia bacterium]|nr:hypothetical protein [Clostridia bacterium]
MSQTKAKTKPKKTQKKPLRMAQRWGKRVPAMAGRMVPLVILIAVMGLMFTALQAIEMYWLRAAISAAVSVVMGIVLYSEGLNSGVLDVNASHTYIQAQTDGRSLTEADDAACYHPLKALCAAIMVFALPLALSVYLALNAQEYTYVLQSLPKWLTQTYSVRGDVMAPLAAYDQTAGMAIVDWVRLFVRLFILVFINLFEDPQKMTASIDRLSPLMVSLLPMCYMVGYLLSPRQAEKIRKLNRRAKKVAVRRAERRKVAPELLGAQNQVHYGHKKEEKARKKKELI